MATPPKPKPQKKLRKLSDALVSEETERREKVAVMRMAERPANWRDTDICNTDYWAVRPKT